MAGTTPLPLLLPPGADPESGAWNEINGTPTTPGKIDVRWFVPGGLVWVPVSVSVIAFWGAYASTIGVTLQVQDQDLNTRFRVGTNASLPASWGGTISFAYGTPSGGFADANGGDTVVVGLPYMAVQPGWNIWIRASAGLAIHAGGPLTVIEYTVSGAGATTGAAAVPIGPFMLVPGPSSGAVAA